MSYSEFKEQCAKVTASYLGCDGIADEIRALPLPEVNHEPVLFQYRTAPDWTRPEQWSGWKDCTKESHADYSRMPRLHNWLYETRSLYLAPPDAEAIRAENAQLRSLLSDAKSGLQWYHDQYPERVSEALKGGAA